MRKGLVSLACAALLLIPLFPLTSSNAQDVGTKWTVEATILTETLAYMLSEEISGTVEVIKDPISGDRTLNGTGEGRWTYRHHENEQCPGLSGDGIFPVTFSGHVQGAFSGDRETVFVSLMAAPGSDPFGSGVGNYTRSESVTCHDEEITWEQPRILAPLIIGPLGKTLKEWHEGITTVQDHRNVPGGAYVKITAKIVATDDKYRIHGKVFGFKSPSGGSVPLFESKVVLADYAKVARAGEVDILSTSRPDFEEQEMTSKTDASYEFELTRPASEPLRALVVSLLWYDGESQFAVTSGEEVNSRFIPIYQVVCIDQDDENCIKWEKKGGVYEAEVDFQYGHSSAEKHLKVMDLEEWSIDRSNIGIGMNDAAWIYFNSHKAMKYFESVKETVGNILNPVMIDVYNSHSAHCKNGTRDIDTAFFDFRATGSFGGLGTHLENENAPGGTVTICKITSSIWEQDAPMNREYHELGHYLQNDMYYPSSNLVSDRGTPHAGYKNDGTNDSFVEGFAEFAALLIAEHNRELEGGPIYPIGTNLEVDYRVWGDNVRILKYNNGTIVSIYYPSSRNYEEFAVAGLLWDLHDRGQEFHVSHKVGANEDLSELWLPISEVHNMTKDNVALFGEHILDNIRTKKPMNLDDLYGAFSGDVSTQDLDMIFISHGVFGDVPTRDLVHGSGESIGLTGSTEAPERPARFSPPPKLNGSYISSERDAILEVKITHREPYSFYDFSYDLNITKGVPAYFEMPPSYYPSIAEFFQVFPDDKISGESSLTINSTEYWHYIDSNSDEDAIFKKIEIASGQPTSPISESEDSTSSTPSQPSGCLIATAAFGSELAPQVQILRNFRDNHILSTASGSSFMSVFNAWYYSFSPQVADYERQQPWLQQAVRIAIYPLLGILQTSEKAYAIVPGEFGSISAGLIASALIGAVYFSPLALSVRQVRNNRLDYRIAILLIAVISGSVVVAVLADNAGALMVTTALLVVATLGISAIYAAKGIWKLLQFRKR